MRKIFFLCALPTLVFGFQPSQFLYLGHTSPGGAMAKRHKQRVIDTISYAQRHFKSEVATSCFGDPSRPPYIFEPGLLVGPEELVKRAASRSEILAGVGYMYSNEGILAAKAAETYKMPVISPSATLDELYHGHYFRALGISLQEQGRLLVEWILSQQNSQGIEVHVVTQIDQIFSLRFSKIVKGLLKTNNIPYKESVFIGSETTYANRVAAEINRGNATYLFFSDYWNTAIPIIKKTDLKRRIVLGNSEWVYNEDVLAAGLAIEGDVYMLADFAPASLDGGQVLQNTPSLFKQRREIEFFRQKFREEFGYTPTAIVVATYDTLGLVCELLTGKPKTREDFLSRFLPETPKEFYGLRGKFILSSARLGRSVYLSKWNGKKFTTVKEFMAWM